MIARKISEKDAEEYVIAYKHRGEDGLYEHFINLISPELSKQSNIDIKFLELSEDFFSLNRIVNREEYFVLGKIMRRLAHTFNRRLLKTINGKKPNSKKFLVRVK